MTQTRTIDINDRFRHALHVMEYTNRCLFITGKAGTGKSTLLSHFCARTNKRPVVLAPTGVAALNVRGQTIHKFFHFYIDVTPDKIRRRQVKPRTPKLYKKLKTIIIDEVSMVRADMLDCIDEFLRLYGPDESQPFGGVQMIFVGDLYQLPPVVSRDSEEIFSEHYETPYFFSARCLREADFTIVELDKIYRQKEQKFVDLLNRIRTDSADDEDIAHLNTRFNPHYQPNPKEFFINLTTTNRKADEINAHHLAALPAKMHSTNAIVSGDFGKEFFPTAPELQFKLGAQIMLINNDSQGRWVNGSIGVIEAVKRDENDRAYINVRLTDEHDRVAVYPHTWEVYRYGLDGGEITANSVGSFTQFPFRLAWAVTIHKAQGKTFDHVMIDIDRGTFAAGQMYVALSRCTSFEGIVLKTRIARQHIRTDARIVEFLARYPYEAPSTPLPPDAALEAPVSAAESEAAPASPRSIVALLASGIDPTSGQPFPDDSPYRQPIIINALKSMLANESGNYKPKAPPKPKPEGAANHGKAWTPQERELVVSLFRQNTPLREIAVTFQRTRGSIRGELIKQGLITMDDVVD
jgi:ATP-dependent exoDNAse (exonuclease V) alpha subunit